MGGGDEGCWDQGGLRIAIVPKHRLSKRDRFCRCVGRCSMKLAAGRRLSTDLLAPRVDAVGHERHAPAMASIVEKRVSALEYDVEQLLGRLPGAPLSIRLQALNARIRDNRIATASQFAEMEENTEEILRRLAKG